MQRTLLDRINGYRAMRVRQRSRHDAALRDMPAGLEMHWQRTAHLEFEGIPKDAFFFARASEGLLDFFACVRDSGKRCALPSKAADSVWHAWIGMAPYGLDAFCQKHFGRCIAHVEGASMAAQLDAALANCLVQARRYERIPAAGPAVPRLFGLDRLLRMPGGYAYTAENGRLGLTRLNRHGQPGGPMQFPAALSGYGLLGAGLISAADYHELERKTEWSGASCGAGAAPSRGDGDAGAGGNGGDGGGCGSGCGGAGG
ncbi:MAG: hypothetical protein V4857_23830 [Pseudomonadota bacterium]